MSRMNLIIMREKGQLRKGDILHWNIYTSKARLSNSNWLGGCMKLEGWSRGLHWKVRKTLNFQLKTMFWKKQANCCNFRCRFAGSIGIARMPRFLRPQLGSISPNFVRQAKICRRTAFGEKDAIQFHQHFVTLNWPQTFLKKTSDKFAATG